MAEGKQKRVNLSVKRKIDLIKEVEAGRKKRKDIAKQFGVAAGSVTQIVNEKKRLEAFFYSGEGNSKIKRPQRTAENTDVEHSLLTWLKASRSNKIPISGPVMKTKAEEFAKDLGFPDWKCSKGWINRFNKRHNITFRKVSGERESVDDASTDAWVEEVLVPTLQRFEEKDIFTVDETGLFWRALPDDMFAFSSEKCHGGGKSKERLTITLCCNMDGTEKRPLTVIGKFNKPRCFKAVQLPVAYTASPKAWTTTALFENWLRDFDRCMDSRNRKVLLVLDNCTAHKQVEGLKATELLFLPPKATSKLQPLDTGIIKNLKFYYRTRMLTRLIGHMGPGSNLDSFRFSLLDAIQTLTWAWGQVSSTTINNSFGHAGFVHRECKYELDADPAGDVSTKIETELQSAMVEPVLSRLYKELNITMDEFCDFDRDLATCAPPSTADIIASVSATSDNDDGVDSDADDCGDSPPLVSRRDAMSSLSNVGLFLMQTRGTDDLRSRFQDFSCRFEHFVLMSSSTEQSKITDFFRARSRTTATDRPQAGRPPVPSSSDRQPTP